MPQVTAQLVKELRETTQAGMMDCKKALLATDGDMEKAIEYLREKGLAAAAKKASRIAAEGMVEGYVSEDCTVGVIVEVNCETDFVANTDNFKGFCHKIAKHIAAAAPADVDTLLTQKFADDPSKTITDLVSDATVAIGEKISIRRFARYEAKAGVTETYIHMGGKIGVLVEVNNDTPATFTADAFKAYYHDLALQIAAAKPEYVLRDEVPTDTLDKEKKILREQALNEGKPEKIVDRMVEGRIAKFYKDICLTEQPFVKDPDQTINQYTAAVEKEIGAKIGPVRFERFERGEGIEKRHDDLAAEIASMQK
ncbi:MAG TPA: translation elongation factor Ts [Candidatus Limiplasma sp.]|nr:translation elongation factor Ts [Candidatus Limiplasma sp.]